MLNFEVHLNHLEGLLEHKLFHALIWVPPLLCSWLLIHEVGVEVSFIFTGCMGSCHHRIEELMSGGTKQKP